MTTSTDVAVATIAHIRMNPNEWNQASWEHCYAGHFARLDDRVEITGVDQVIFQVTGCRIPIVRVKDTGEEMNVGKYVREAMGLDTDQSLFSPANKIDDLEAGVIAFKNGESVQDAVRASQNRRIVHQSTRAALDEIRRLVSA